VGAGGFSPPLGLRSYSSRLVGITPDKNRARSRPRPRRRSFLRFENEDDDEDDDDFRRRIEKAVS
jgi:hypothetical protein